MLFSFLFVVIERAIASEEEGITPLGGLTIKETKILQKTPIGSRINFNLNGKSYDATYTGERIIDGKKWHIVVNMEEISETAAGNVGNGIPNGNNSSNSSSSLPQASQNSGTVSASNAAMTAAATKIIYRMFFVSPELDQRISQGQANLSKAQTATQVAIKNYKLEVDKSVQNAATALANLAKELNEASRPLPKSSEFLSNTSSIDFSTSDPVLRQSLTSSYYKIANAEIRTPIDQEVQQLGIAALSVAEFEASNNGDIGAARSAAVAANAYAEFLTSAADLLIGIDPISSFLRDSYELFTGTNCITEESLTDFERALKAVNAGATLVTLGGSPVVMAGVKTISKISQRIKKSRNLEKIFQTAEHLPLSSIENHIPKIASKQLPEEAFNTIKNIDRGPPFPYKQDHTIFGNKEGKLPIKDQGYYREYTVETPNLKDRGSRRIVTGKDGEKYYTDDHYKTFQEIMEEILK